VSNSDRVGMEVSEKSEGSEMSGNEDMADWEASNATAGD
jgi:hypothetical protein